MDCLSKMVEERGVVVVDGAMGTELFSRDLEAGDAPERWNLDNPESIVDTHASYIEAGSDIILTNSFGGTAYRLKLHDLHGRVVEINRAAAANARTAADAADRRVLVAGSMGPTGELMVPLGTMSMEDATSAFADQAEGLAAGGADLLWIETMSSLEEVDAAVAGAKRVCDLPIVVTMSFDTAGKTMMGVSGLDVARHVVPLGVAAIGVNCGANLTDSEAAVAAMKSAAPDTLIVSKANAGIPQWHGAELSYSGTPEVMGAHAHRAVLAGATVIGGCCGSAPAHIRYMADVLAGRVDPPDIEGPEASAVASGSGRPRRRRRADA